MSGFYGVYRAIVVDSADPENLNRLRLRVPSLTGQSVTTWAWPMARIETAIEPPPIGSGVFVMFEGGDISYPLWTGSFANSVPMIIPGSGQEVAIQTSQPASADISLWVDTDASSSYTPIVVSASQPDVSSGVELWVNPSSSAAYTPQYAGGRNYLINGDFSVNQRGFTSVNTTSTFTFDRWKGGLAGGVVTFTAQSISPGSGPTEYARSAIRIASSAQSGLLDHAVFYQNIEDVRRLAGKVVTASFWAKAASGTPKVTLEFMQRFGTGGSAEIQYTPSNGTVTLDTTWKRYTITTTLPSVAGKTINDADSVTLFHLWTSGGSDYGSRHNYIGLQSATIDFWGFQLEDGPIATNFEQKSYADELRSCMRYFQRWTQPPLRGTVDATPKPSRMGMSFPVPMRATPTPTLGSGGLPVWDGGATATITALGTNYSTQNVVEFDVTSMTGGPLTTGRACVVYQIPANTTQYLDLSAEW